jgi:hypothetical protein
MLFKLTLEAWRSGAILVNLFRNRRDKAFLVFTAAFIGPAKIGGNKGLTKMNSRKF